MKLVPNNLRVKGSASFEEILDGYPDLEREDIKQAIEYAAWLAQEQSTFGTPHNPHL